MSQEKELYRIRPDSTALLIIDAQKVYSQADSPLCVSDFEGTVANINAIAAACREKEMPVFVIRHIYDENERDVGRLGDFGIQGLWKEGAATAELDPALVVEGTDIKFDKARFSSFANTPLEGYLKSLGVDTVIVTGFMTQYCSVSAARHTHDLDYKVIFVEDANDGPSLGDAGFGQAPIEDIKRAIHTVLATGVAEVVPTGTVLERIRQTSPTATAERVPELAGS